MSGIRWIIWIVVYLFIMLLINGGLIFATKKLTSNDYSKRYINKIIIMRALLIPIATYLAINYALLSFKILDQFSKNYYLQNIIFERGLSLAILIAFFGIKAFYYNAQKENKKVNINNVYPYYKVIGSDNVEKYYIEQKYKWIGDNLVKASYVIAFVISFVEAIFAFNNLPYVGLFSFIFNYGHFIFFSLIYLLVYEVGIFLDGEVAPEVIINQEIKVKSDLFNEMLVEYRHLYKDNLLLTLDKDDEIKDIDYKTQDDYIYSKIFTPIVEGDNMIIETENLDTLNDIVPPLINLIFGTNRKILFVTENDAESIATYEWLKKCNVVTENVKQVVQVFTEYRDNDGGIALSDSNVDICIGTVGLLLENKETTKKADTIFAVNVDNIIVNSPINLNILTRMLSENKEKNVQYILFTNEVNGLQQSIEGAFYSENFSYQVVRQKYTKDFHAMFYAKEKGMLQKKILPAMATDSIGAELPLLITPFKYGFENIFAFSEKEPYEDEMIALHKAAPFLKTYFSNKIYYVEEKITFLSNEHYAENKDSMIVAYDDTENNLILLLKNYIKYAKWRILVNIVSDKYILRDYMIDNVDFFMQNYDFLGKIVPYHKEGKKILLFKLINELCLENFEEEYLLNELNKITEEKVTFANNATFNAENYVLNTLRNLIKEIFGVDIRMDSYLYRELAIENAKQKKFVYSLSENIKYELPRNLFTEISFITSDQRLKKLDKRPMYEIYQNYAVGQYQVFDGKSYLISNIDAESGIVNLIYNDRINSLTYLNKKDVAVKNVNVEKSENVYNSGDLKYEKISMTIDVKVTYSGYYKFSRGINFNTGFYEYQKNDYGKVPENNYLSHKAILIKLSNDKIKKLDDKNRLKISETLAFLFNEVFKTIYCGANQYFILRAVASREGLIDNEVNDMYSPIVLDNIGEDIGIIAMEDTELEKGVLDSFTLKIDTTIIPLICDYLEWVIDDEISEFKSEQIDALPDLKTINDMYISSFNNEKLNFYQTDKLDYLKLGKDNVEDYFDLKGTLDILRDITISGGNSFTATRKKYLSQRKLIKNINTDKNNNVKPEPFVQVNQVPPVNGTMPNDQNINKEPLKNVNELNKGQPINQNNLNQNNINIDTLENINEEQKVKREKFVDTGDDDIIEISKEDIFGI